MKPGPIVSQSRPSSPLHRLAPQTKIVVTLVFVFVTASLPKTDVGRLGGLTLLLVAAMTISKVPALLLIRRSAVVLPFTLLILLFMPLTQGDTPLAVDLGFYVPRWQLAGLEVVSKALVCAVATNLLWNTTPFPSILRVLSSWKTPAPIVLLIAFIHTSLFITTDEARRLDRAVRFRTLSWRSRIRLVGSAAAMLIQRGFRRSEVVYHAMTMRGLSGSPPRMAKAESPGPTQVLLAAIAVVVILAVGAL